MNMCVTLFSPLSAAYSVVVYENVTIGAELIRVVASDADSGERGSIRYTLSGSEVV